MDTEWRPSSSKPKNLELEFEDEEQMATVTVVQDFDVQLVADDPVPSTASPAEIPSITPTTSGRVVPAAPKPRLKKPSKKRPAYETKAERSANKSKIKAKRAEKVDDERPKHRSKGARQRKKISKRPTRGH